MNAAFYNRAADKHTTWNSIGIRFLRDFYVRSICLSSEEPRDARYVLVSTKVRLVTRAPRGCGERGSQLRTISDGIIEKLTLSVISLARPRVRCDSFFVASVPRVSPLQVIIVWAIAESFSNTFRTLFEYSRMKHVLNLVDYHIIFMYLRMPNISLGRKETHYVIEK